MSAAIRSRFNRPSISRCAVDAYARGPLWTCAQVHAELLFTTSFKIYLVYVRFPGPQGRALGQVGLSTHRRAVAVPVADADAAIHVFRFFFV